MAASSQDSLHMIILLMMLLIMLLIILSWVLLALAA